ncbi:radical SAM protein, partial [Thermoproteota archaeon]
MLPDMLSHLIEEKGYRCAYNYIYYSAMYNTKNPFLIKLLQLLNPYPVYIEIEVTTRCNLRCIMCEHTYWKEKSQDMPFKDFKMIVDQFPHLIWIGLTGIGESFMNKDFLKMLRYVKSRKISVELFDTFYFIDNEIGQEIQRTGQYQVQL